MPDVYLIGDSTVQAGGDPFYGWGSLLQPFCRAGVHVFNHAKSGESSRSFWESGLFGPVRDALRPGDLLMIQFGHNDEKDDHRHTVPSGSYVDFLCGYLDAAQERGAVAALITSVSRRFFLSDGSLLYTHGEYPQAVRALAQKRGVPCIDLKKLSRALYLSLGPAKTADMFVRLAPGTHLDFPDGHGDLTHFNRGGAEIIAGLVATAMLAEDTLAWFIDPETLIAEK